MYIGHQEGQAYDARFRVIRERRRNRQGERRNQGQDDLPEAPIHREDHGVKALQRRFGTSISLRAPGLFLAILRRKAENAGGSVIPIPTGTARLSQTCHGCGTVQKKALHERVHQCACGVSTQRDLYSAFLARHTDADGRLHADRARAAWSGAEALLRAAWSRALQSANGRRKPSTFGTLPAVPESERSLAQERTTKAKAPDQTKGRAAA